MKYIIWGTGKAAMNFLDAVKQYFKANEIIAFADNNAEKWSEEVRVGTRHYSVISPEKIIDCVYDRILICSTYENEIKQQLIEKLGISEEKVINRQLMIDKIVLPTYDSMYSLSSHTKVLLVGNEKAYENISSICKDLFVVQGFVDERYLSNVESYDYDYVLLVGEFLSRENLYTEEQLIERLVQCYKVSRQKILTYDVYDIYRMKGREISCGEEHGDKKFMVIKPGRRTTGLGSIVLFVANKVKEARQRGYIPIVDMMSYRNQYLDQDEVGKLNAWERFFLQPDGYTLDDIKRSKHIRYDYLGSSFSNVNITRESMPVMCAELQKKLQVFKEKNFLDNNKILGVLFRGTDYVNLKPRGHYVQPDLNMMLKQIKEKEKEWGKFDKIYVCTEVQEAISCFEDEFLDRIIYYPQVRFCSSMHETIAETVIEREYDTFLRGADYWVALECLAMCDALIAGNCGGTSVALALNDSKYKHKYIFNLGLYE